MAYQHHHGATAPSASPPLRKEAPPVARTGLQENARGSDEVEANSAGPSLERQDPKRLATAKARAALLGVALVESVDWRGRMVYLLGRWAYTTERATLDEVEALLRRMEGRQ